MKLDVCVIHSFRHTFGTRLGEAGVVALTMMCIMGRSTVANSQEFVHPAPGAMERAFERLDALNQRTGNSLPDRRDLIQVPTVSTTSQAPAQIPPV
jgi:hypothetical protein